MAARDSGVFDHSDDVECSQPSIVVHLVDGTYELFRHFHGQRRFNKGKDKPFGAVVGVLHTILEMIESGAVHVRVIAANRELSGVDGTGIVVATTGSPIATLYGNFLGEINAPKGDFGSGRGRTSGAGPTSSADISRIVDPQGVRCQIATRSPTRS